MEHTNLSLEYDKSLIERILDDLDMRYIILFLYIVRNDLFKDLKDLKLIESYERVIILDEIFKNNVLNFWEEDFIDIAIDLGLFKNIRSVREFNHKDEDFIIRLGEETITIENDKISVPDHTLFLMINKKFKFLTKRNYNLALIKLKGVKCQNSNNIHQFIFKIGENDYTISDDIYYILDQLGNVYQAIKIEITIEGVHKKYLDMKEKSNEYLDIFEPKLRSKSVLKKIFEAIKSEKDVFKYLRDEKIELPDKFTVDEDTERNKIGNDWYLRVMALLNIRFRMEQLDEKILEIKKYYSGKDKKFNYLEFIEKVSFNEDNIVNNIQNVLLKLREDLIEINKEFEVFTKKELKLLNIDYERYLITRSDD
ncbi:MAG: hypothetical protein ACTSSC_08260 [Promethearchaeota archaeon]